MWQRASALPAAADFDQAAAGRAACIDDGARCEFDGLARDGLPVKPPGFHTYVSAPPPVRTEASPAQIVAGEALAVTVGIGLMVTEIVLVLEQLP